jgi:hypothetical protein
MPSPVRSFAANRTAHIWLALNVAGIGVFLAAGSILWPDAGLEHCAPDFGDSLNAMMVLPALIFLGVILLSSAVVAGCSWRTNPALRIVAVSTPLILVLAAAYDLHRTFRVVWPNC